MLKQLKDRVIKYLLKKVVLTDDEVGALITGYQEISSLYQKIKRSKESKDFKDMALPHWKKRMLDFQSVFKKLNIDVKFKEIE